MIRKAIIVLLTLGAVGTAVAQEGAVYRLRVRSDEQRFRRVSGMWHRGQEAMIRKAVIVMLARGADAYASP